MASKRAPRVGLLALALLAAVTACGGVRRFPLRDPLWKDPDQHPFLPPPQEYDSPFAWDGANQLVFRPIARFFAVDPAQRAINVNSMDEVADSSWFTNRIGMHDMTVPAVVKGGCPDAKLDPDMADGTWLIDLGKANGANPGFRINVPGYGKFMMKADPDLEPERATGATAIATRMYHDVGYWAPCDSVVYFRPSLLKLKPGLMVTDNSGIATPFDDKALKKVLASASHRGQLVRMAASSWLPGKTIGPYSYDGRRKDDPNDVVDHEDRRELRGARLLAAWTNHFDSREENTMNTFLSEKDANDDARAKDGDPSDDPRPAVSKDGKPSEPKGAPKKEAKKEPGPGYVRHYIIDIGDAFGSVWFIDGISQRLGHAYYLDLPYLADDFITLGTITRPWEKARRTGGIFNYYNADDFDPELWRPGYPNPAFGKMLEGDGAWMARILARFTDPMVDELVKVGDYSDPVDVAYLQRTLKKRRDIILQRYLKRLSPIGRVSLEGNERLCGVDEARYAQIAPPSAFRYAARMYTPPSYDPAGFLPATAGPEGHVCVDLKHLGIADGVPDGDPSRYLIVDLANTFAKGPLRAHLYDLGGRGFRLVGIERPSSFGDP
jgi:hypothetical protein